MKNIYSGLSFQAFRKRKSSFLNDSIALSILKLIFQKEFFEKGILGIIMAS